MARTNILFISKYRSFFGAIAVLSDLLVSHAVVVQENCHTLPTETLGEVFSTISSCPPQFLQTANVFRIFYTKSVEMIVKGSFSKSVSSEDISRLLSLLSSELHFYNPPSAYFSNQLSCSSKSLHQTFLRAFFSRYQNGTFVTLLAAFHFLPIVNF